MADDATHARNRRMTATWVTAFLVFVLGVSLDIGWMTFGGFGAFIVGLLGRYWS